MKWLIIGLILGTLTFWLISKEGIKITWYQWVIGTIGVAMLLFTGQNYFGMIRELDPSAANFVLVAMGIPSIVVLALAFFLPKAIGKVKSKKEQAPTV